MFSRRDMLAATAAGGLVTAATMTTADAATPVKSEIAFGNPNDPPRRIRRYGISFQAHFPHRRPTSATCR
jgi:hypothetical protein